MLHIGGRILKLAGALSHQKNDEEMGLLLSHPVRKLIFLPTKKSVYLSGTQLPYRESSYFLLHAKPIFSELEERDRFSLVIDA